MISKERPKIDGTRFTACGIDIAAHREPSASLYSSPLCSGN
jgi:hypothetical protein